MLANFFNKSKPAIVFIIAIYLFVYFTIANVVFNFAGFSWSYLLKEIGVFFSLILFLILIKFIINKNNLTLDNSYALLLAVFLLGIFHEILFANRILFANIFLLLAYRKVYSLRSNINTKLKLFDAGFWIGISVLIYSWSIFYIILIYAAMLLFQKVTLKNLAIPLVGLVMPVFIFFTYTFYVDNLEAFYRVFYLAPSFSYNSYNQLQLLIPIAFLITIAMWSIVSVTPKVVSSGTSFKKLWNLVIVHLLISVIIIVLSPIKNGSEMLFMVFPITIIIANFLQKSESKNFKNLIFYLFLLISFGVYFL